MVKVYRGDVILAHWPDGKNGLKTRPLIVFSDTAKDSDSIVVYCTTQNNGDDKNNIKVFANSEHGIAMGLEEDTYIRPYNIGPIAAKFMIRKIGRCPLISEIQRIVDKRMAG